MRQYTVNIIAQNAKSFAIHIWKISVIYRILMENYSLLTRNTITSTSSRQCSGNLWILWIVGCLPLAER